MKLVVLILFSCGVHTGRVLHPEEIDVARGLSSKTWMKLVSGPDAFDENIVMSPLSIAGAMYMLAAGSAGASRLQILEKLSGTQKDFSGGNINEPFEGYTSIIDALTSDTNAGTLEIANAIYHQEASKAYKALQVTNAYSDILNEQFIQDIGNNRAVDFRHDGQAIMTEINDWVYNQTHGKIPEFMTRPLPPSTLVALFSSLYFKGSWAINFKDDKVNHDWYYGGNITDPVSIDVDYVKTADYTKIKMFEGRHKNEAFQVFEIPMEDGNNNRYYYQIWYPVSFFITDEAGDQLMQEIMDKYSGNIHKKLREKRISFRMPKISMTWSDDLVQRLKSLGITDVFNQDTADLSPMLGPDARRVSVTGVQHAVQFDLDKHGIEGAAVTSVVVSNRGSNPNYETFNIEKPFYFAVKNECWEQMKRNRKNYRGCSHQRIPIFTGKVVEPVEP